MKSDKEYCDLFTLDIKIKIWVHIYQNIPHSLVNSFKPHLCIELKHDYPIILTRYGNCSLKTEQNIPFLGLKTKKCPF